MKKYLIIVFVLIALVSFSHANAQVNLQKAFADANFEPVSDCHPGEKCSERSNNEKAQMIIGAILSVLSILIPGYFIISGLIKKYKYKYKIINNLKKALTSFMVIIIIYIVFVAIVQIF